MILDERKLLRYTDIGFYVVFIPIFLLLIPTDHIVERDPYFFTILMVYMAIIHYIHRLKTPLSAILGGNYRVGIVVIVTTIALSIILTWVEAADMRLYNAIAQNPQRTTEMKIRSIWMLYFIEFCFMVMTTLTSELIKETQKRQNIEKEKTKAEVALYKSQINPHFMLNTLNTLYGLYITRSERTGELFLKFTDMIKYTFANSDKERVMICEEVKYIREYIDLHSLRLSEQTSVRFSCEVDDESLLIPPMILISFIENAFKYGVSSSQKSQIEISISLKNRNFIFKTQNAIFSSQHSSTGIGIKNCQKRLEMIYNDNFTLEYGEKLGENIFDVMLKIRL